jgi:hypothetical protein
VSPYSDDAEKDGRLVLGGIQGRAYSLFLWGLWILSYFSSLNDVI